MQSGSFSDESVRKAVWEGGIPIVFNLHHNDLTTFEPPLPYYIVAPRGSYLPLVTANVRDHFVLSAPVLIDEMWFDYKGTPLKWHLPIGLLFDLFHPEPTAPELPWPLTVHFHEFPENDLLRCPNDETIKNHFMNTLKEANYIKFGDSGKVNKLSLNDSNALWDGLRTFEYDTFSATNKLLAADASTLKHVPIRVCSPNLRTMQDLVSPKDEKGNERTLGNVLAQFYPELFSPSNTPNTTSSASTTTGPPASPSQTSPPSSPTPFSKTSTKPSGPMRVVVQGITPSLDATIVWLYDTLSHPDNFLYISLLPASS
jgi:autophagy-related protein 5